MVAACRLSNYHTQTEVLALQFIIILKFTIGVKAMLLLDGKL